MNETIKTSESCQDVTDSSITAQKALELIQEKITPVKGRQSVTLRNALGSTLAEPVISPMNVPAHRNSAMDGYALSGSELPAEGIKTLHVIGTVFAGKPFGNTVASGECVRIMTGAKMPESTDTVVLQERVERDGDKIRVDASHKSGANVRQAGEDIAADSVVLDKGVRIGPAQLGLLASLGIPEVTIRRRLRVAFFSSGDEIRSIGEPLDEGQIYDSNRYTLYGMLSEQGVDIIDMGVIPDREETIQSAMREAAEEADLILTSGGVSVGEADYIAEAIGKLGTRYFSKVAIKPGRPLTFGKIGKAYFFGLPGNPVAVMITFLQFVRPALDKMMGKSATLTPTFKVRCLSNLRKSPGRTEFQRGILEQDENNELIVRTTGRQGSGVLSSMSSGNCFIYLPDSTGNIEPGDHVDVQPFGLLWR